MISSDLPVITVLNLVFPTSVNINYTCAGQIVIDHATTNFYVIAFFIAHKIVKHVFKHFEHPLKNISRWQKADIMEEIALEREPPLTSQANEEGTLQCVQQSYFDWKV